MLQNENLECKLGEVVNLPHSSVLVKKTRLKSYEYVTESRYICVRERGANQPGLLLKVLGPCAAEDMLMIHGEPFCKDDKLEGFSEDTYYSYRFPTEEEVRQVLDIVAHHDALRQKLKEAHMRLDINGRFWTREVTSRFLLLKKALCFDTKTQSLLRPAHADTPCQRLTVELF